MPKAFPAQPCENSVISRSTEFDQFADAFLRLAPLFPIAHTNTPPEPMIRCDGIIVLQGDTEVVHPTLKIGTDFFVPSCHGDTPTAASKSAQFGFELRNGFPGNSKSLPSEGETEEGSLLGLHYLTLAGVHPDFEPSLKEPADTLHHALPGTFGLHQYDEVIGIPCELMPPFL